MTSENIDLEKNQVADNMPIQAELILALDYGVKKTGMALGNTITQDARPFDILAMDNGQPDWENLLGIIAIWKVHKIVIGLPLNMDGTSSMLSKRAHKFARRLAHRLMERKSLVRVYMHDERLSSVEAREIAWDNGWITNERDPIDDISACLVLNSYLADPDLSENVTAHVVDPDTK